MPLELQTERKTTLTKQDLCFIILKNSNFCLYGDVPTYKMDICGKQIIDWTLEACKGNEIIQLEYTMQDNVFDIVKSKAKDKKVVCVLYADTPLISQIVLHNVWNLFVSSGERICRLPRGFILEVEALKENINILQIKRIAESLSTEFFAVNNLFAYKEVQKIMRERIINYHMENGVVFRDSNSVYIDADCEIAPGVVIFPNNHIYDGSTIASGCVLYPNNTIIASNVEERCVLKGAYIQNSKVTADSVVDAYEKIIDCRG